MSAFITTVIVFILLDALWLGFIAKKFYIAEYGQKLRLANGSIKPHWPAALSVYILLIFGINFFVLPQAGYHPFNALIEGALFGLVTYGTYDFTNYAVMTDWPAKATLVDVCWGMVICGVTAFFGALI